MNSLQRRLETHEEMEIGTELERLYFMQGKFISPDDRAAMVVELSGSGFTYKAIIDGLLKLRDKPMKIIRLCEIKDAIREHNVQKDTHGDCRFCGKSGFISMKSKDMHSTALPCVCSRGSEFAKVQGLTKWNGKAIQVIHGAELHLVFPDPKILTEAPVDGSNAAESDQSKDMASAGTGFSD